MLIAPAAKMAHYTQNLARLLELPQERAEGMLARIERLLAGPYLELFARHAIPKWTVWGNEVFEEHTECDRWDCHGDQTPAAEPDDFAIPEFLRRSAP